MAATMPPPSAAHQLQVSPASYVFNNNTTSCRQWSYRRGSTAGDGSDRRVRLVSGRAFADGIDVPSSRGAQRGDREDRGAEILRSGPTGWRADLRMTRTRRDFPGAARTDTRPGRARIVRECVRTCARVCVFGVYALGGTVGGGAYR